MIIETVANIIVMSVFPAIIENRIDRTQQIAMTMYPAVADTLPLAIGLLHFDGCNLSDSASHISFRQ